MDTDTTEASTDHPDQSAFGPVGVIGAGAMGAGIAQVAATAGHAVALVAAATHPISIVRRAVARL